MASRTVHYALAILISKKIKIENIDRFIAGELLPDAIEHNNENHAKTHFKITYNVDKKLIDTKSFLEEYKDLILKDELYLGYYLHLIQDAVYRKFLYFGEGFVNKRDGTFVKEIHNDYALLNEYLIQKYDLKTIDNPINLGEICSIYDYRFSDLLNELEHDFIGRGTGNTVHLTEEIIDRYINMCVDICCDEINSIRKNKSKFEYLSYAWSRS